MNLAALLDLQRVDTATDQALAARERLPERRSHADAAGELAHIRARRDDVRREQSTQEAELADIESRSSTLDAQRARLDTQLKTVIAPREAEALLHEIQVLELERGALDDRGLVLLESSSEADRDLLELADRESRAADAEESARRTLDAAVAAADTSIDDLRRRRRELAATIDVGDLETYEKLRRSLGGVAVTVIEHGMCAGCHMDLSVAELDAIKRRPAGDVVECPNCNRLLVR
ncbi:MAG: zinc ribbon domain-containing protein [Actinomycetota bacterium]